MQVFQSLAGYSLGKADMVRRAMSKKKMKELEKERVNFIYGNEELGIDGAIKRGGSPSAMDRVMATRMGYAAVRALMEGKTNRVVVSDNNIVTDIDIEEGLAQSKDLNQCLFEAQQTVAI